MLQMLQRYTVRKLRHGYQFAAVKFGVPANQVNCGSPLTHKTIVAVRRAILKVKKGWNILVGPNPSHNLTNFFKSTYAS
jgi:hypothetical protein